MFAVTSPNIEAVGYDADLHLLHVKFKASEHAPSHTLEYKVTPEQWEELQPDKYLLTYKRARFPLRLAGSLGAWR